MTGVDIVVLGGGIAGCVAARRFVESGRSVHLVSLRRAEPALEGLSPRAAEGLRGAGCERALAAAGPWVERHSHWNGEARQVNGETLVERQRFDDALLDDARDGGAGVSIGRVERVSEGEDGWLVSARAPDGRPFTIEAPFLVEARGRQAPAGAARRRHGPLSVALGRFWRVPEAQPTMGAVAAFPDGWAWFAVPGDGHAALQIVVAGEALPGRAGIERFYHARAGEVAEAADWLAGAEPVGAVSARNANPVLGGEPLGTRSIRIGDAALALDPLSGHGQFQAAGTALNAVAVVNTLLDRPRDADLARTLYRERVEQAFLAQTRVGRDFYRLEKRWAERPFWAERAAWPDDAPAHPKPEASPPRIARRPVVEDDYVVARDVVVTVDHPRGVWQVGGVPLVPLMRFLDRRWRAEAELVRAAAEHLECAPERVEAALGWLTFRGLLVARESAAPER
jgi:flavin-dependent dehydrogenase